MLCAWQKRPILQLAYRLGQIQLHAFPQGHVSWKQGRNHSALCEVHRSFSFSASKTLPFDPAPPIRLTDSPNPGWKYGEGYQASAGADEWKKGEEEGWKSIDTSSTPPRYVAKRYVCPHEIRQPFQGIISSNDQRDHPKTDSVCILSIRLRRSQSGTVQVRRVHLIP